MRIPQRLMNHLGRLRPQTLHTVDKPRRQDPDRNVESLRRPAQQIKSFIGATAPLGHQDALGLLDHWHSVRLGRTERYGSSLHGAHASTPSEITGLALLSRVSGRAARAAHGGNAARAASAWEHRAGVTSRPTRQTPAGAKCEPARAL